MNRSDDWKRSGHITGQRPDTRGLPRGRAVDLEFESYLELETEDLIAEGWSREEAREEALRRFGDLQRARRRSRTIMRIGDGRKGLGLHLDTLRQDLGFAIRTLSRAPALTLVTALILAIGIGANATIFSAVEALLLRDLPYPESGRLATIDHSYPELAATGISVLGFRDYRTRTRSYESMAVTSGWVANLTGVEVPERLIGGRISHGYFETFGIAPALGRTFLPEEDELGNDRVVILGDGFWQNRLGGREDVLGHQIRINGEMHVVVGVMPPGFEDLSGRSRELWKPIAFTEFDLTGRAYINEWLRLVARLRPGVTLDSAREEIAGLAEVLREEHPELVRFDWGLRVDLLQERVRAAYRTSLLVLAGAVGLVLLIACANVANLLLARALGRRKEMAIRGALGAGRRVLFRQQLTESLALACLGGVLGLGVAWLGTGALARFGPADFARADLTVDMRVLLFTLVLAIVVGVVFGLIPAVQISRSNTSEVLREGGHGSRSESGARRLRKGLVVAEFALALVLLAGAGLMVRTLVGLQTVDPGFVPENVLTTRVTLPASSYSDPESSRVFFGELLDRIRALPGVLAVGTTSGVPFTGQGFTSVFNVEGYTVGEGRPEPWGDIRIVHPGLEEALQIPLLKGRFIDATDDTSSRPVVVVDTEAVSRFWPDEEPLGKRITFNNPTDPNAVWFEVVGVVGHTLQNGLDDEIRLQVYFAFDQVGDTSANLVIRSAVDPVDLLPAVRASVLEIDPNQPISAPALMEDLLANSLGGRRTSMFLLLLFAGVAIVLAALGIYGVMMQVVGERTHEIGVRLTCGARGIQLVSMVMRSALMLALIGMILGLAGILALGSVIRSQLYGVAPTDPVTLVVVAFTILVVAALSTLIPAARAARTDPTITLRQE